MMVLLACVHVCVSNLISCHGKHNQSQQRLCPCECWTPYRCQAAFCCCHMQRRLTICKQRTQQGNDRSKSNRGSSSTCETEVQ